MSLTLICDLDTKNSSPLTLTRHHSYSSLGKFIASLTVANALGKCTVVRTVSVERVIHKAITRW